MAKYDHSPAYPLISGNLILGWNGLKKRLDKSDNPLLLLDGHSAINWKEVFQDCISHFIDYQIIDFNQCRVSNNVLRKLLSNIESNDSDLYPFYSGELIDFFDPDKIQNLCKQIEKYIFLGERILCIGSGSGLIENQHSSLVLLSTLKDRMDLNIQGGNHSLFGSSIINEKISMRTIDEPVISIHLRECFKSCDFYCDYDDQETPTFISGDDLRQDLHNYASRPFRVKPVFFETLWGGQFLKNKLGVGKNLDNIGGSFEFAQKENDFYMTDGKLTIRIGLDHFISLFPREILGNAVFNRCGAEFPLRLNFTDTVEGGNLSSQVHPNGEYTMENFGIYAHMDEKYFVIHAQKEAKVNLGLKERADVEKFHRQALLSQSRNAPFAIEEFQSSYPSRFGKVFYIPPGTIHNICEGNLIMEIITSHTLFTFRFYDYLRRDKYGKIRPLQIKNAFQVLNSSLRSSKVTDALIPDLTPTPQNSNMVLTAPLNKGSYTTIQHIKLKSTFFGNTHLEHFQLFTVVCGDQVTINWSNGSHELHYLETILVPGSVGEYSIDPGLESQCDLLCVSVKPENIRV